jgi:hypothetical protein
MIDRQIDSPMPMFHFYAAGATAYGKMQKPTGVSKLRWWVGENQSKLSAEP